MIRRKILPFSRTISFKKEEKNKMKHKSNDNRKNELISNKSKYLITFIIIGLLAIISTFISIIALSLASKCNGYPLIDKMVQQVTHKAFRLIRNVTSEIQNDYNNSTLENWIFGDNPTGSEWLSFITRGMLNKIDRKSLNENIFTSKIFDCQSMQIKFSTRHGIDSIDYENLNTASNRASLHSIFSPLCNDLRDENIKNKLNSFEIIVDNNLINIDSQIDERYKIIIKPNTLYQKFISAIISDFPTSNLEKQRIYSFPCYIIIYSRNLEKQRYDATYINVILFSYYPLESIC